MDDFFYECFGLVVECDDVIVVLVYVMVDVEENFGYELECGGDFVGECFGWVEVIGVEVDDFLFFYGVIEVEFV